MSEIINYYDQIPFGEVEFAENPEPRCPCLLLLDASSSMIGEPIDQLNEGLLSFRDQLLADRLAAKRVEIAVIAFGQEVKIINDFELATNFYPTALNALGMTPMGEAIETGIGLLNSRKQKYKENGISYYRPWVFLITDGCPTDNVDNAAKIVMEGEESKSFAFFSVGVDQADMDKLSKISVRKPLKLKGLEFKSLFEWLSNSMSSVSRSSPGDEIQLDNPSTPDGWATL